MPDHSYGSTSDPSGWNPALSDITAKMGNKGNTLPCECLTISSTPRYQLRGLVVRVKQRFRVLDQHRQGADVLGR